MEKEILRDRMLGCLYGQAVGDALGLGTEFLSKDEISKYYPQGLSRYEQFIQDRHRSKSIKGAWTDDTDMMLCILDGFEEGKFNVRNPGRITAHFFICFIALLVLKIMQKQLDTHYPASQIRQTLSAMNLVRLEGFGYIPSFNASPLATSIQENAKIHIDRQINTPAQIRADYRLARKC